MKILIVQLLREKEKKLKDLIQIIQNSIQKELIDSDIQYLERDQNNISDHLYETQGSYLNLSCLRAFQSLDIILVVADGNILPWSTRMEKILVLLRMCFQHKKYLFASSSAMQALVFLSATNFDRNVTISNQKEDHSPNCYFIDRISGDIYQYSPDIEKWLVKCNAGIHNSSSVLEYQTLGKYVFKAPIFRQSNCINFQDIYPQKNTEIINQIKSEHTNHDLFTGIEKQKFLCHSTSRWDVHSFYFTNKDRQFSVLADSDKGPMIVQFGSFAIATHFEIDQKYPQTTLMLRNFIRYTARKINEGFSHDTFELPSQINKNPKKQLMRRSVDIVLQFKQQSQKLPSAFVKDRVKSNFNFRSLNKLSKPIQQSLIEDSSQGQFKFYQRKEIRQILHPQLESENTDIQFPSLPRLTSSSMFLAINTKDTPLKIKKTDQIKKPFTNYKKHRVRAKSTLDI